jgi:hypothetical protein
MRLYLFLATWLVTGNPPPVSDTDSVILKVIVADQTAIHAIDVSIEKCNALALLKPSSAKDCEKLIAEAREDRKLLVDSRNQLLKGLAISWLRFP